MPSPRPAIQVVDLAFGDCGKGTTVDFLARRHPDGAVVVRFNGGPQAGHNVVTPDGRHHTFAQFGSGSFVPGVRTFLSRFMLVEPYALLNEARHLAALGVPDPLGRLTIDARCPIITPAHQAANRLRELARGDAAHGTCGMGVGETVRDTLERPDTVLHAGDLSDRRKVKALLRATCERKAAELGETIESLVGSAPRTTGLSDDAGAVGDAGTVRGADPTEPAACSPDPRRSRWAPAAADAAARAAATLLEPTWVDAAADNYAEVARHATIADESAAGAILRDAPTLLFEGAQGVLLDEWFGFHPHTTWSTTTFANADSLLDEAGRDGPRVRLGVVRTYFTRHGAGPFVTEDPALAAALPEPHNTPAGWQGRFRVGPFDCVAARYALGVAGGADLLAVTHLDRLASLPGRVCTRYACDVAADAPVARDADGRVAALRVGRADDLPYQERLTAALRDCRPAYEQVPVGERAAFLELVERELGTPVGLVSDGPSAADKRLLADGWSRL